MSTERGADDESIYEVAGMEVGIGRVRLSDLAAAEGEACEAYKASVSALTQSLSQYSAVIVELAPGDAALLQACLQSAPLYFQSQQQQETETETETLPETSTEWCRTSGYLADPQLLQETFDYRPGLTLLQSPLTAPAGLPPLFPLLARAARCVLDALSFSLNLRASSFHQLLDDAPLRNHDVSSSVLSVCCHSRPSFLPHAQPGQPPLSPIHYHHQLDKTFLTLIKPDHPGLHIKDLNGHWLPADTNLGPHDVLLYPGLALYQATAGYVAPALHRTDVAIQNNIHGRCSVAFKLMPRPTATLTCTEMQAAGYGVDARFQNAIPVSDFMQTSHPVDHLFQPMLNEAQDGNSSLVTVPTKL